MVEKESKVVALDDDLDDLRGELEAAGYRVKTLKAADLGEAGAVVISGQKKDFLGMSERHATLPVIDATGKTARDILNQLQGYNL